MNADQQLAETEERKPDLRYYWMVLKRRFWLIVGVTIAVTALGIVYTVRKPKIYQATATVIVDPQAPNVLGESVAVVQLGSGNLWSNDEYYNTQQRILTSRSFARQVVDKFQLQRDKRLVGMPPANLPADDLVELAADALQGRIIITLPRENRVIAISVLDRDPGFARDLANHVREVYIDQNVEVKRDTTREARGVVAKLLDVARGELNRSETELYAFRKDNNMLSVSFEDRQDLISKSLDAFSAALTDAQRKRIDLEARRNAVARLMASEPSGPPTTFIDDSPAIAKLREQYYVERSKLRTLEERYGPLHPQVVAQRATVDGVLADLRAEVQATVKGLDAEIASLREAEGRFHGEVNRLTQEALDLNQKEVDYRRLSRDAKNAESVYGQLLTRYNDSGMQEKDKANNIKPLDEAIKPTAPIAPNLRLASISGVVLGLLLALALAFLIEFLDRSVKSQADIEGTLAMPFLGLVPSIEGPSVERYKYILKHPTSTVAESCRTVRTNILFSSPDRPLRCLMVTSASPVEGKTTTVVNLGVVMAQSGHRTLIVDADMRRPSLHRALGAGNEAGLSSQLFAEGDPDAGIKTTDVPNLFLMPCGPLPPNPAELLQTERFAALVTRLRGKFDRIIFDTPPILAVTDAAVLSRLVDGAILVVRAGKTARDAVARARGLLRKVSANLTGVVLNDVDLRSAHYSTYYQYRNYRYDSPYPATASKTATKS